MTKEETIKILKWLLECTYIDYFDDERKALETSIKFLEQKQRKEN